MRLRVMERGEGNVVVLLHGLFGAARNLATLQTRLGAPDQAMPHRVIAMDLRNHGQSPHAPGMDYATLAGDVIETLDALGVADCAVIGHSMGGKVAMRVALDAPARVSRLLVADIAPVRYAAGFAGYATAMQAMRLEPGLSRVAADAALTPSVADAAVRAFLLQNLQVGTAPGWRIGLNEITAGLPAIMDWPASAKSYIGPTLFVAGDRSDYIRAEHHPIIQTLFPAARFATLAHAGHWLHVDNPSGFLALISGFLETAP